MKGELDKEYTRNNSPMHDLVNPWLFKSLLIKTDDIILVSIICLNFWDKAW